MSVLRPTGLATAAVRSRPSALAGTFAALVLTATVLVASVAMTVSASAAPPEGDPAARAQLAGLSDMGIAFSQMMAYLSIFVIGQVMALAVAQRRREIALLRAIGAEPRQIRRMVAVEALGTALAALPVGCGLGTLLGRFWLHGLAAHGMAPAGVSFQVGWQSLVTAGGVLLVCSQLGGLIAGWRASRTRPSAALAESSVQGGERAGVVRGMASLAALAGAVALTVAAGVGPAESAAEVIPLVVLAYLVAIGLAGPWIGRCTIALCAPSLRAFGGAPGELAVAGTRARARRLSAAITPVALVTAFGVVKLPSFTGSGAGSGEDWGEVFGTLLYVGFAGLVAANTLVMLSLERLREFSLLRAVGAERRQIVRTVATECAIITVAGVGAGMAAGCAVMLPLGARTGTPLGGVPGWAWLAVALCGAVLVGVSSGAPLPRMLRVRPMDGLTRHSN
ncbi:ABC transporter permease [Actinoallomurus spadix]|uniref:ABC3 transporter permease C-terminal domain-containing protein n=1 Tax=Actinoallomurus spadix TaxID=79912 RepID=A0ABN0XUB4_9ACTN|nr:ABC transporter permease [Actinoallomurus spadix]MCO5990454.1 ABC transporter permease [Actinoallomurus spadix]